MNNKKQITDAAGFWYFTDILKGKVGTIENVDQHNTVFLITLKNGTKEILKTFRSNIDEEAFANAKLEYTIPMKLAKYTEHVAKPIDIKEFYYSDCNFIEILFEWGGESLLKLMEENPEPETILDWAKQSLEALEVEEKVGIFHSDIKPENLVYANNMLKIIDFGSSVDLTSKTLLLKATTSLKVRAATYCYLPPELLMDANNNKIQHGKVDVYCWGMSFYHILSKKKKEQLWEECNEYKRIERRYSGFLHKVGQLASMVPLLGERIVPILKSALAYDPSDRPSFAALYTLVAGIKLEKH